MTSFSFPQSPSFSEIAKRAHQLATTAATNSTAGVLESRAKVPALVQVLIARITDLVELDLDPMEDSLEQLMPDFDFNSWAPISLAIRRRAQKLVSEHILFPGDTCGSPDIVTEMRAEAMEGRLISQMQALSAQGINPLSHTWEQLTQGVA